MGKLPQLVLAASVSLMASWSKSGLLPAESLDELAAPREPRVPELPEGFADEVVAAGITGATGMAVAPDGRIFICEQTGALRVVRNDALLPDPAVTVEVDSAWERGLLGVALDPDFTAHQRLFLLHVSPKPFPHHRVSRFTLRGDSAVSGSEVVLLEGDDQTKLGGSIPAGHQGGGAHFGKDGCLYLGIGEQTAGSPSQRLDTLQGKLLRIRADGSIPEDNPFYRVASGKYRAIWAYGLRNPFGFAVEPDTGRIFVNDVGSSRWEEINEGIAGANYGWPDSEGPTTNPLHRGPLHAYGESPTQSIAGGAFYEPSTMQFPPEYAGKYFFADYILNWIRVLDPREPRSAAEFARGLSGPVDLQVGPDGSLYCLNRNVWVNDAKLQPRTGTLHRISYTPRSGRPAPRITAEPVDVTVAAGDKAVLRIEAMGDGLRFQWEKEGRPVPEARSASFILPAAATFEAPADGSAGGWAGGGTEWRCVVANAHGAVLSRPCRVRVAALRAPAAPCPTVPGLEYEYHELSKGEILAFRPETRVAAGSVESFALPPRARGERFGVTFQGFLEIARDGVYTFHLAAKGRTKLFVSSAEVAGTLMAGGPRSISGSIGLRAGLHPIRLDYSRVAGPAGFELSYSVPGGTEEPIPSSRLFRLDRTAPAPPAPPGGPLERRDLVTTLSVPEKPEDLPLLLSETGAFLSLADLTPAPGLIPYDVNSPLWSDGAIKRRWIAIPGDSKIGFSPRGAWRFPAGTVLVKHFELAGGGPPPRTRRLETRLLVVGKSGKGYGATYKWRPDQSEADLLPGALVEETPIEKGAGLERRTWYYPGRSDCLVCHTANAGFVLGVNTRQLNRAALATPPAAGENQLQAWSKLGLFGSPLDGAAISTMARLAAVNDLSAPLEDRVRSYLDSNCSHCHRPGGARGEFDARFETPMERQKLIDGSLVAADLCVPGARVVTPGARSLSMIYLRMSRRLDVFNMPPLASFEVDTEALAAVGEWIDRFPGNH
jgi:uncharacterized repeat protein (TIGR03806 family)